MYYFDNAATTFPKPESVYSTMDSFARTAAGNPGRGSHRIATSASDAVDETRDLLAQLFNAGDSSRVVFACNTTDAINMALHGLLRAGDHVVTSTMEHNAVIRPLMELQDHGVSVTRVSCASDGSLDPKDVDAALRPNTRLVVLTHASNVTGTIMPIDEIGPRVRAHGAHFMVDAAQTAGVLPIDMQAMAIDLLAFPGHKCLLGPTGTGGLALGPGVQLHPHRQGGTGTRSMEERQPRDLPEALESGTLNCMGIAGLGAGLRFLLETGHGRIRAHEASLLTRLLQGLRNISGLVVFGPQDVDRQVGVVSVRLRGWEPVDLGVALDQEFDVAVRTGLHCAPGAHRTIGTFPTGTVRLSPGYFTRPEEVDWVVSSLEALAARPR